MEEVSGVVRGSNSSALWRLNSLTDRSSTCERTQHLHLQPDFFALCSRRDHVGRLVNCLRAADRSIRLLEQRADKVCSERSLLCDKLKYFSRKLDIYCPYVAVETTDTFIRPAL